MQTQKGALLVRVLAVMVALMGVESATTNINWPAAGGQTFPIFLGDSVQFNSVSGHTVLLMANLASYNGCNFAGAVAVTTPFLVTPNAAGTYYYGCDVPGHCGGGIKATVVVQAVASSSSSPEPPSSSSSSAEPPSSSSSSAEPPSSSSSSAEPPSSSSSSAEPPSSSSSSAERSSSSSSVVAPSSSSSSGVAPSSSSSTAAAPSSSSLMMTATSSSARPVCQTAIRIHQTDDDVLYYEVDGVPGENPAISMTVGCEYTITVEVSAAHPLIFVTSTSGNPGADHLITTGFTPAQQETGTPTGTTVFTFIPESTGTFFYFCIFHQFSGSVVVTAASDSMAASMFDGAHAIVAAVIASLAVLVQRLL